jgi:UDP-N-acetylglucosamine--N-acetylmuramyl-(pentapeptide) pyrophosphoryl-undecaprenol N-acetylglucosamine transferase
MIESTTILMAGGGTGGHLFPGIAVAEALRSILPEAKPLFLCTQREIDRIILEPTGFEFIPQPIVPPVKSIGGLLKFWKSWRETKDLVRKILHDRKPIAALGLGGYAAGVAIREAAGKKIPSALINPDVIPGKANQFLMKRAKAVCCQFASTASYIPVGERPKIKVTGCPIRNDIRALPPRDQAARRLNLDSRLLTLAVTGASLGAKTVNEAVLTMFKGVGLRGWQVLHLAGREHAESVRAGYRELAAAGTPVAVQVIDFTPAMADVWAVTDLAVSRSGASSCAELTACGIPSILLPYPFHRDMHQRMNARELSDAGAAALVDDEKDRRKNADKLRPVLESLLYDSGKRRTMAEAARKLGRPDAAENVARVLMEIMSAGR